MDGDINFGCSHRHKRTRTQMEHEGSSSPTWSTFRRLSTSREPSMSAAGSSHPQLSGLHLPPLPRPQNMPPEPGRRFPGDGFDFRRPATLQSQSSSSGNIIDLTSDEPGPSASNSRQSFPAQRPPRFAREIIDIDEDDAGHSAAAPASPEIEFVSARRISPVRRRNPEDDDVEITGSAPVPEERRQARQHWGFMVGVLEELMQDDQGPPRGHFAHLRAHIQRAAANRQPMQPPRQRPSGGRRHIVGFVQPILDFDHVGFDMGMGGNAPAPPPPTYEAPPAAPEGFTRTATEEDVLVCPNCGDELCVGESDLKKQVWINKACGHVYCGECTANRFSSKRSSKGKEKATAPQPKSFKTCVVEDCGKKVSHRNAMIQVFL